MQVLCFIPPLRFTIFSSSLLSLIATAIIIIIPSSQLVLGLRVDGDRRVARRPCHQAAHGALAPAGQQVSRCVGEVIRSEVVSA